MKTWHELRAESFVILVLLFAVSIEAQGAWNSVTGIKDGSDTASELANPWDGERLLAFGGTLNFAGNVSLDGELWIQQMNGWGNPVVNIPGTLTMFSPSGQFTVQGGADLNIGNPTGSSVEAGIVIIRDGVDMTLNEMIVHDDFNVGNVASLHILTDFQQDGGDFLVNQNSAFSVDGTFTKTGNGSFNVGWPGSSFNVGNPVGSSVEAGLVSIRDGVNVVLNEMTVHDNFELRDTALLQVLGNYVQDGGDFVVSHTSTFDVDGTFTKTGNGSFNVGWPGSSFNVGNPAGSSVEAGVVSIRDGVDVVLNEMTVHDNFEVRDGAALQILTNYTQDGGDFVVDRNSSFDVDGTFTKTGNGSFVVAWSETNFTLDNPASSTVEAGVVSIRDGLDVVLNEMTVHDNFEVRDGAALQILTNYVQDGGNFVVILNSNFTVDGTFTKTGSGSFITNSTVTFGDAAGSSLEAGVVLINSGSQISVGSMTVHDNLTLSNSGTLLHVLGDYEQDGGNFDFIQNSTFTVDGTFTNSSTGNFDVSNATFSAGNTDLRTARFSSAAQAATADLILHGDLVVEHAGSLLHATGDYAQDTGNFHVIDSATMNIDGDFNYSAGNTLEVRNNGTLTSNGSGNSIANFVTVHSGGKATIGSLTAHGDVNVQNSTSMLRVGGDYLQVAGGFAIGDNATLNVDGSFRYAVPGSRFISFGNGFLRVGDTLTLEEGHFWNLATNGGRVRVGDGLIAPAAGTFEVTVNGTLAGEGTVVGNLNNLSGTVSPGMSPGRLDVTGNYTQGTSANLAIEIGGPLAELQFDQLFVSGAASLAGSLTVDLIDLGEGQFAPVLGQTFSIFKAGGGVTGTFANLNLPTIGTGLDWQVSYLTNFVQLEVIAAATLPGDFDLDGDVDGRDFLVWQRGGSPNGATSGDLALWQSGYASLTASYSTTSTSVPEPSSIVLLCLSWIAMSSRSALRRGCPGQLCW